MYAWRLTVPEGHRFDATQALRQVLNRAIAWGFLEFNPAKLGVPNRRGERRRSGRSSRGSSSKLWARNSGRCMGRW